MTTAKSDAFQASNKWPGVKPGELDQVDGDFSTIIHQLLYTHGYVMGIHDN